MSVIMIYTKYYYFKLILCLNDLHGSETHCKSIREGQRDHQFMLLFYTIIYFFIVSGKLFRTPTFKLAVNKSGEFIYVTYLLRKTLRKTFITFTEIYSFNILVMRKRKNKLLVFYC